MALICAASSEIYSMVLLTGNIYVSIQGGVSLETMEPVISALLMQIEMLYH